MKRLVIMLSLSVLAFGANAQNDAISKYFAKYMDNEDFMSVNISAKMFQMMSSIEMDDKDEQKYMEESIGKIKGVRAIAAERDVDGMKMYNEALGLVDGKGYEELMSVREEDKRIRFLIKEKDNKIDELFMVMGGDDEFGLLSIIGDGIDLNMLYKLSKSVGVEGFRELERLGDGH